MEVVRSLARSMAIDADRATFEASLDPTTQGLSAAYTVRARSDTPMAEALATYGAIRPRFVAAGGEADAAWVGVSLPMNAWLRMAIEETLGGGVNGMKSELSKLQGNPDYPKAEAALAELESVYRRLTAMDHFEQEMVIAADETGTPRFVWRIAFAEARALVAAFAKLLAVGSPPGTIAPDADGILELPGTYPARLAATDEALIIGLRCADGAPVKAVLDAQPGGSGVPPVSVRSWSKATPPGCSPGSIRSSRKGASAVPTSVRSPTASNCVSMRTRVCSECSGRWSPRRPRRP
jgi:hypothetical protein